MNIKLNETIKKKGKKVKTYSKLIVIGIIATLVSIGIFAISTIAKEPEPTPPPTPEPIVITETFVEGELKTIGKFNTTDYTYTIDEEINEPLKLFEKIKLPGTRKSLKVRFTGVVKAGYVYKDLKYTTIGDTVIFSLPNKPHIENYLTGQTAMIEESVWLNPIDSDDYKLLSNNVLNKGLSAAEEDNLYIQAEEDMKSFLTDHFEKLGYKVKFTEYFNKGE
jgi:hypothetical protein